MKRILFLLDVSLRDSRRGTPLRIYNFLRQLSKQHNLILCCRDVPADLEKNWIPYPQGNRWVQLKKVRQLIRDKKIEIIFTATEAELVMPVLLSWLTRSVKLVIDLHGVTVEEAYFHGVISRWKRWWLDRKNRFWLSFYQRIFVVSERLKAFYPALSAKMVVVHGGVNMDEFSPLDEPKPPVFTIGYMGNPRTYQGLEFLFAAVQQLKERSSFPFRLLLIVSSDETVVHTMLKEAGIVEETTLLFNLPHEKMREAMNVDVLVIPRPWVLMNDVAFPSKLPECLAMGCPVLVTDVGPVAELVAMGCPLLVAQTANLVPTLTERLEWLLSQPEKERLALGERGRSFVQEKLTWDKLGQTINQTVDQL